MNKTKKNQKSINKKRKIKSKRVINKSDLKQIFQIFKGPLIVLFSSFIITLIISSFLKPIPLFYNLLRFGIIFLGILITIDYFYTRNEKAHNKNLTLLIEVVTLIVLFGQFEVSLNQFKITEKQTDIIQKQTEILEKTSQSTLPDILVVSSAGYQTYKLSNVIENKGAIRIGVTNLGKATAPFLSVRIYSAEFYGKIQPHYSYSSEYFNLQNLNSLEYNYTGFEFSIANQSDFIAGPKNITFQINCPTCREPIKYENVPICIYKEKRSLECPLK